MADVKLRPKQKEILRYRAGKMGISAVPGSGKTWTLSRLAAQILNTIVLVSRHFGPLLAIFIQEGNRLKHVPVAI